MGENIYCDDELAKWLKQITQQINSSLPPDRQLSQKDVTRMLPKLFSTRTIRLNIILDKPRPGRPSGSSKITQYEEFLI